MDAREGMVARVSENGEIRCSVRAREGDRIALRYSDSEGQWEFRSQLPHANRGLCNLGAIRLNATVFTLSVEVVDPAGQPIVGAHLTAHQRGAEVEAIATAPGRFGLAVDLLCAADIQATADGFAPTNIKCVNESSVQLRLAEACAAEMTIKLPDGIFAQDIAVLIASGDNEYFPDIQKGGGSEWRGRWGIAPKGLQTVRIVARCPIRILEEMPIQVGSADCEVRLDLAGWVPLQVTIPHCRSWGVYCMPLDDVNSVLCSEFDPSQRLLVKTGERVMLFGPGLLGVIVQASGGAREAIVALKDPPRVECDSATVRLECEDQRFRDESNVRIGMWVNGRIVYDSTTVGELMKRKIDAGRIDLPLPYVVSITRGGVGLQSKRVEPPYEAHIGIGVVEHR